MNGKTKNLSSDVIEKIKSKFNLSNDELGIIEDDDDNKYKENRIKQLRKEKNLTQEKLGKKINVEAKSSVSDWENGYTRPPEEALANYFGVTPDYLMGRSEFRIVDNEAINKKTGLEEHSIELLKLKQNRMEKSKSYDEPIYIKAQQGLEQANEVMNFFVRYFGWNEISQLVEEVLKEGQKDELVEEILEEGQKDEFEKLTKYNVNELFGLTARERAYAILTKEVCKCFDSYIEYKNTGICADDIVTKALYNLK